MQHEPRGFLSDAKCAMQFVTADSIFAVHYQPHSGKPLLQGNRRILKHGADLERELLLGVRAIAAIQSRLLQIGDFLRLAVGAAHDAIQPANARHELATVVIIAEELDCLLESLWGFHAPKVAEKS